MDDSALPTYLIPVAFLVIFPIFWSAICMLIAVIGGWRRLARDHASDRDITGDAFAMRSGRFGIWASYSGVLSVTVGFEGLLLRPIIFFRPGHPRLVIPWHDVLAVSYKPFVFRSATTMRVRLRSGGNPVQVQLYGEDIAAAIKRHKPDVSTLRN